MLGPHEAQGEPFSDHDRAGISIPGTKLRAASGSKHRESALGAEDGDQTSGFRLVVDTREN